MPVTWYIFKRHPTCHFGSQDYPVIQASKIETWRIGRVLTGFLMSELNETFRISLKYHSKVNKNYCVVGDGGFARPRNTLKIISNFFLINQSINQSINEQGIPRTAHPPSITDSVSVSGTLLSSKTPG